MLASQMFTYILLISICDYLYVIRSIVISDSGVILGVSQATATINDVDSTLVPGVDLGMLKVGSKLYLTRGAKSALRGGLGVLPQKKFEIRWSESDFDGFLTKNCLHAKQLHPTYIF